MKVQNQKNIRDTVSNALFFDCNVHVLQRKSSITTFVRDILLRNLNMKWGQNQKSWSICLELMAECLNDKNPT